MVWRYGGTIPKYLALTYLMDYERIAIYEQQRKHVRKEGQMTDDRAYIHCSKYLREQICKAIFRNILGKILPDCSPV